MRYEIVRALTPEQSAGLRKRLLRVQRAQQELAAACTDYEESLVMVTGDKALGVDATLTNVVKKPEPVNRVEEALTNGHG